MIKRISYRETLPIRQAVLWPYRSIEELILKDDPKGIHFGFFMDGLLVAVISVFKKGNLGQFRKFACLDEYQGKGIGSRLLNHTINYLVQQRIRKVWCNARVSAREFYKNFGFVHVAKSEFSKGEIKYEIMVKHLKEIP